VINFIIKRLAAIARSTSTLYELTFCLNIPLHKVPTTPFVILTYVTHYEKTDHLL